ncbi:hypothetical protein CPB83DRAFT_936942 [Crepidotus variabilis]|uniref:Protein kinase domain-containing protein n=1 Tax=Crepidotus variabilis TaxID=179855 RepID=A0A9P6EDL7_9AGAR|nr:hypothetical protein CPB83DRAFT_936942 [Crepidotus variabilis]
MPVTLESRYQRLCRFPRQGEIVHCNSRQDQDLLKRLPVWLQNTLTKSEDYSAFRGYSSQGGSGDLCILHVYRSEAREVWADHLEWFRRIFPPNPMMYSFMGASTDTWFCYIVFRQPSTTLRTVLDNPELGPLSRRHACEIVYQMVEGVQALILEGARFGDITPDEIEMINPDVVEETYWDPLARGMAVRKVLKSTELRVVHTGTCRMNGEFDQLTLSYRAPELAFGICWPSRSVVFAMGCITYEVLTHRLLLSQPFHTSYPLAQMVYQYHHLLAPIPDSLSPHFVNGPGVLSLGGLDDDPEFDDGVITADLETFVRRRSIRTFFQMDILDDYVYELIAGMTDIAFRSRPNVAETGRPSTKRKPIGLRVINCQQRRKLRFGIHSSDGPHSKVLDLCQSLYENGRAYYTHVVVLFEVVVNCNVGNVLVAGVVKHLKETRVGRLTIRHRWMDVDHPKIFVRKDTISGRCQRTEGERDSVGAPVYFAASFALWNVQFHRKDSAVWDNQLHAPSQYVDLFDGRNKIESRKKRKEKEGAKNENSRVEGGKSLREQFVKQTRANEGHKRVCLSINSIATQLKSSSKIASSLKPYGG